MIQFSQRLYLSQFHTLFPRVEFFLHLFDGNHIAFRVGSLEDGTVGT